MAHGLRSLGVHLPLSTDLESTPLGLSKEPSVWMVRGAGGVGPPTSSTGRDGGQAGRWSLLGSS